ncbi:hypothetical protein YDYSY3_39060 [Paenibacillus chitinolyticus]|uniref:hypothetical protein n=1 Tax=Paenibacillus chitinolyticus TaxID=79263 RepID=UPI0026E4C7FB|nr:hypothetical protein [Paenibacillus chitinolyticus]GKS12906.1 hypothetical protein YDYSY3_39060 [Paenibacillus chitinolyticus]
MAKLDLTNQKFGRLKVISEAERKGYVRYWNCRCDCGTIKPIAQNSLRSKKTTSCGCYNRERTSETNSLNLKGRRFGYLEVIEKVNEKGSKDRSMWRCLCKCEKEIIVPSSYLTSGDTTSCGCRRVEVGHELQQFNKDNLHVNGVFTPVLKTKMRSDNSTGIKGVSPFKGGKYRAQIGIRGKKYSLGVYATQEQAGEARKAAEEKYHKPYLDADKSEIKDKS